MRAFAKKNAQIKKLRGADGSKHGAISREVSIFNANRYTKSRRSLGMTRLVEIFELW